VLYHLPLDFFKTKSSVIEALGGSFLEFQFSKINMVQHYLVNLFDEWK